MKLNEHFTPSEDQIPVMELKEGHHAVIAPPGSGKTELLYRRLVKALDRGVKRDEIACLTFTNRAARNMVDRAGKIANGVFINNFHSFGAQYLRKNQILPQSCVILDKKDESEFIDTIINDISKKKDLASFHYVKERAYMDMDGGYWISFQETLPLNISIAISYQKYFIDLKKYKDEICFKNIISYFNIDIESIFELIDLQMNVEEAFTFPKGLLIFSLFVTAEYIKSFNQKYLQEVTNLFSQIELDLPLNVLHSTILRFLDDFAPFNKTKNELKNLSIHFKDRYKNFPYAFCRVFSFLYLVDIYKKYVEIKHIHIAVDFNDLLNITLKELVSDQNKRKYSWIQVDEVQDLNPIQWELLKQISHNSSHITVFGDFGQSIYSFLGGGHTLLKKQLKNYDSIFELQTNWRSPKKLIDLFSNYAKDVLHTDVNFISKKELNDQPILIQFNNNKTPKYIVDRIIPTLTQQKGQKVAVLLRTNRQVEQLSGQLKGQNIPHFCIKENDVFLYGNAKDFFSFLSVLKNNNNKMPWQRLFKWFGRIKTFKKARYILNSFSECGVSPLDLLYSNLNEKTLPNSVLFDSFTKGRLVIFDTETTGLNVEEDDIIQIAAIEVVDGAIGEHINIYIKTDKDFTEASKIHRITPNILEKEGVSPNIALNVFKEFVKKDPLVAHNLSYDRSILQNYSKRKIGTSIISDNHPQYCTLNLTRIVYPAEKKYKLEYLLDRFNLKGVNSHNALDDVKATYFLLKKLALKYEANRINLGKIFIEYSTEIENFQNTFFPLWLKILSYKNEVSFRKLFETFFDYIANPILKYENAYVNEIEEKIIRHMDFYCKHDKLKSLLEKHLENYIMYNEADLILDDDNIIISTIHRSKGLEFDSVIIPNADKENFPFYYAKGNPEKEEEEKRILYVAMTRAKQKLVLCYHKKNGLTDFMESVKKYCKYYEVIYCDHCKNYHSPTGSCVKRVSN